MPSEHRLHPLSILFLLGGQLRSFALPLLFVLVGASSAGWEWQKWLLWMLVPSSLVALSRYATFRYRYEPHEMVIRSGLLFRNERHVPYARIQNLDAVRNVFHRLLGVVEVRVQTGSGTEPEATLSVLPLADFEEMRARVSAAALLAQAPAAAPAAPRTLDEPGTLDTPYALDVPVTQGGAAPRRILLELSPRELALHGFVENRGFVVISAAFGLLWELGLWDRVTDRVFGEEAGGRGVVRDAVKALFADGPVPWARIALMVAGFAAFLLLVRLLSVGMALVRLHGFRLAAEDAGLRTEFGLFTRVITTVPLRRIQTLTVREGPLHRLLGRLSVRVDTAGGGANAEGATQREWLAPILRREALPALLHEVLPGVDLAEFAWQPPAPRAFRRAWRGWQVTALLVALALAVPLGWKALGVPVALVAWGWLDARRSVARQGWALSDGAVAFRSGWIWRRLTVARLDKVQAVALHESPFDRRHAHASVRVDTAGAGAASHRVDIPYMARETARELSAEVARRAARIAFRW